MVGKGLIDIGRSILWRKTATARRCRRPKKRRLRPVAWPTPELRWPLVDGYSPRKSRDDHYGRRRTDMQKPTRIGWRRVRRRILIQRHGWASEGVWSGGEERQSRGGATDGLRTGGGVHGGRGQRQCDLGEYPGGGWAFTPDSFWFVAAAVMPQICSLTNPFLGLPNYYF